MTIVYVAMAVWLLLGAALRIALQLSAGSAIDPLPIVSGGLGLVALLLLLPAYDDWRNRS